MNILEICHNAALRLATGLPRWTPLPVLRREALSSDIVSRLRFLTRSFLLRVLSAPAGLRLDVAIRHAIESSDHNWKWWNVLQEIPLAPSASLLHVIRFSWPPPPESVQFAVTSRGLPFQSTSLPGAAILQAWYSWFHSLPPCSFLATDASKDGNKTSVAAVAVQPYHGIAGLLHHSTSVFTAEAQAIDLALSSLPLLNSFIIILSDSMSVLSALEAWSLKSPTVILSLIQKIITLLHRGCSIHFVWCPGHKGIPPNEAADSLARDGPFSCTIPAVYAEDIRSHVGQDWKEEMNYSWLSCDYAMTFSHLLPSRSYPSWISSRKLDVQLARWRSRTIITHQRLFRMRQTFSPLCNYCLDLETPDHILLACPRLTAPRSSLFNALKLRPPVSFSDVLLAAFDSPSNLSQFITFSNLALPR